MSDDIRLKATKDIPGVQARLADTNYRTRRLKAGDEFFVSPVMAKLLVHGLKKAELAREPGNLPAPLRALVAKVAGETAKPKRRRRTASKK